MDLTGQIVEWNHARGYGFLQHGTERVFLHIRDFAEVRKRPAIGDVVQFRLGSDPQGRNCAVEALHKVHKVPRGRITLGSVLLLALFLVMPAVAIYRYGLNLRIACGYFAVISVLTWAAYSHDKKRAQSGGWRVPEITLHLLELGGGWPAAFLAQRSLRHKTSKMSFKVVFWMIILLHQFVAVEALQHWKLTTAAVAFTLTHAAAFVAEANKSR